MDLINAGWTPPMKHREKILNMWAAVRSIRGSMTVAPISKKKSLYKASGLKGEFEYEYTQEEYNAALERYKA